MNEVFEVESLLQSKESILKIAQILAERSQQPTLLNAVSNVLQKRFCERKGFSESLQVLLENINDSSFKTQWNAVEFLALSLPQRLLNISSFDSSLSPEKVLRISLKQFLTSNMSILSNPTISELLAQFLSRAIRLGYSSIVSEEIYFASPLLSSPSSPGEIGLSSTTNLTVQQKPLISSALKFLTDTCSEPLICSLLEIGTSKSSSFKGLPFICFANILLGRESKCSKSTKELLTRRLLTIKRLPIPSLELLISSLQELSNDSLPLLKEASKNTFETWSEPAFAKHSSIELNSYVTKAVELLMKIIGKESLQNWNLLSFILSGIQERMSSSLNKVRKLGMLIAETLSIIIDPSKPLKFDDENENNAEEEIPNQQQPPKKTETKKKGTKKKKPEEPIIELDPDEIVMIGEIPQSNPSLQQTNEGTEEEEEEEEEESTSVSVNKEEENDDGLIPYSLEEEIEDLNSTHKPAYLRQCINSLSNLTNETNGEDIICVFESIIEIVSRTPSKEVGEIAEQLLCTLIHIHNPTTSERLSESFERLQHSAIVAVAMASPLIAAKTLANEFYSPNRQLCDRVEILSVIRDTSSALSSINRSTQFSDSTSLQQYELIPINKQTNKNNVLKSNEVSVRVGKTRRFHSIREPLPEPVPNRFLAVAGEFFFPFMRDFDKPIQTLNLLGEDSFVLGDLIGTLSLVLSFSSARQDFILMCKTLLSFISSVKEHPDTTVRKSVLRSVLIVVETCNKEQMNSLSEELDLWRICIMEAIKEDPDEQCRILSSLIITEVTKKI